MSKYAIKSESLSKENITFDSFKNFLKKLITKFASKKIETSEINIGGGSLVANKNKLTYKSVNYKEKDYTDSTEGGIWTADEVTEYFNYSSPVVIENENLVFNYVRKAGLYAVYNGSKCLISNFELSNNLHQWNDSDQTTTTVYSSSPLTIPISSLSETITEIPSNLKLYYSSYTETNKYYGNIVEPNNSVSISNDFNDSNGTIKTVGYDITMYQDKTLDPDYAILLKNGEMCSRKIRINKRPGVDGTYEDTVVLDENGLEADKITTKSFYLNGEEVGLVSSDESTSWIEV